MKRSDRMAPVQRVLGQAERDRAQGMAEAQKQVAAAEARLADLVQYRQDYLRGFEERGRTGQSAAALRDYRLFLARLEEAVRQQEQMVLQARDSLAGSTRQWQGAARQVKAVDSVVDRWQAEERRGADRREQKDSDERAQHRRAADPASTQE